MATYEGHTAKQYVMRKPMAATISKSITLSFSGQMAKEKQNIPSVGQYNPVKCYSFISRVGMKNRV